METVVFEGIVEDGTIKVPKEFRNKRVKVIIVDSEGTKTSSTKKVNLQVDDSLEDVIPFADIEDTQAFAKNLREKSWR